MTTLSHDEILRYSRHLIMSEVGTEGQKKLKEAQVLLIGSGGLGSPAAMYLAAAGVGRLGVVDYDVVDASNLQRQIVHGQSTVGVKKVDSAKRRLLDLNPHVHVDTYDTVLSRDNALALVRGYDVVADGTDNFPTRYLVNDACVLAGKPNVYASIFRFEGMVSVFDAARGPCYRCWYPEPPPAGAVPSCAEGGVLGVLPGVLGVLQATEVVKLVLGLGEPLVGRVLTFDALGMRFRELKLRKDPRCAVCGESPTVTELVDYQQLCGAPAHDRAASDEASPWDITPRELAARLAVSPPRLIDVREPQEWQIGRIGGAELIPLGELPARLSELDGAGEIVLYCKSGVRSLRALGLLRSAGFTRVKNLKGGIDAWSREVDPDVPLY